MSEFEVKRQALAAAFSGWLHAGENSNDGLSRAGRARLRRAATPTEAFLLPEVAGDLRWRVMKALDGMQANDFNAVRLGLCAGILAEVKANRRGDLLAVQFGQKQHGDRRKLSEMRFRRLIASKDHQELYLPLKRVVKLCEACDVGVLGADLWFWSERVRIQWTYQYYGDATAEALLPETA